MRSHPWPVPLLLIEFQTVEILTLLLFVSSQKRPSWLANCTPLIIRLSSIAKTWSGGTTQFPSTKYVLILTRLDDSRIEISYQRKFELLHILDFLMNSQSRDLTWNFFLVQPSITFNSPERFVSQYMIPKPLNPNWLWIWLDKSAHPLIDP